MPCVCVESKQGSEGRRGWGGGAYSRFACLSVAVQPLTTRFPGGRDIVSTTVVVVVDGQSLYYFVPKNLARKVSSYCTIISYRPQPLAGSVGIVKLSVGFVHANHCAKRQIRKHEGKASPFFFARCYLPSFRVVSRTVDLLLHNLCCLGLYKRFAPCTPPPRKC